MMSPSIRLGLLLTVVLTTFTVFPARGGAQWHADSITNTKVCDTVNQQDFPASCPDGADGAIIVWEDLRGGSGFAIYGQHLNNYGVATWKHNGIKLCTPKQTGA